MVNSWLRLIYRAQTVHRFDAGFWFGPRAFHVNDSLRVDGPEAAASNARHGGFAWSSNKFGVAEALE